ncbi:MAG: hypothetical protein R3B13_18620 [Polyangiaceae bacterium]
MKGKLGDVFVPPGASKSLTYEWIATDLPETGDCGIYARSTTTGVQVRCTYGCPFIRWSQLEGVGPAIADDSEHSWTLDIRALSGTASGTRGVIELLVNRASDLEPLDLRTIGYVNFHVAPVQDTLMTATAPSTLYTFPVNHSLANGNPWARLFVTPRADGPRNNHPIAVWYDGVAGRWNIYNTDLQPMTSGARFSVQVAAAPEHALVHVSTTSNTSGNSTYIDHPVANENPYANVFATSNYNPAGVSGGGIHAKNVGVWYNPFNRRWAIYNEDRSSMSVGRAFNVAVGGYPDFPSTLSAGSAWLSNESRPPIVSHVWNAPGYGTTYFDAVFGATFYGDILPVWSLLNLNGVGGPPSSARFNVWHPPSPI